MSLVAREDQRRELELQVVVRCSKRVLETELGLSFKNSKCLEVIFPA